MHQSAQYQSPGGYFPHNNGTLQLPQPNSPPFNPQFRHSPPEANNGLDPLEPPPQMPGIADDVAGSPRSCHGSNGSVVSLAAARPVNRDSVLMMGLERLPVPAMSSHMGESDNRRTPSMTFDDFLPSLDKGKGRGRQTSSRLGMI